MEYDFSGYATKNDLKCSDGRIIRAGAFKDDDGKQVPLLWQHGHNDPMNVLGHALLEYRDDGVYAYGKFNSSEPGQQAKLLVQHKNINALSIFANELIEKAKNVLHGNIRELSLVLAGANPGAMIDNIVLQHGDDEIVLDDEAIIFTGLPLEHNQPNEGALVTAEVIHADNTEDPSAAEIFDTLTEEQKNVVYYMLGEVMTHSAVEDPSVSEETEDAPETTDVETSEDIQHSDEPVETTNDTDDNLQHDLEGTSVTTHSIFETHDEVKAAPVLSHSDIKSIFDNAKKLGSFKESVEQYALQHGIDQIDVLFPDAQAVSNTPDFVGRRTEWVNSVMTNTRHTPFSRIKSLTADLTLDEARAKGYVKGNMKREEFFSVAKRVTTPQTVYKKQKLDRDDVIDITDFDVVVWLRAEMRVMLDEEIARAILISDGRSNADDDKIIETNIRPIATDSELYVTTVYVNLDDALSSAGEIVDALTLHRRHYRGSGNPSFYTSETVLATLLLAKDGIGRRLYPTVNDLAAALRVKEVIAVEVMENQGDLIGIMVNLADYTVGSDRGGAVSMFDDFDINYNQFLYLIETRISGALTRPKSALVVRKVASTSVPVTPKAPSFVVSTGVVTVPTVTGVVYKNKLTDVTLTTGAPTTLAPGDSLTVIAIPATDYFFSTSADDEWFFKAEA